MAVRFKGYSLEVNLVGIVDVFGYRVKRYNGFRDILCFGEG